MKLLHTSDWHLGRTLHGADLTAAQEHFFEFLLATVKTEKIDLVLISGDIYDRAVPPVESVNLLESILSKLTQLCYVVITAGNHDSLTRLGFAWNQFGPRLQIIARDEQIGRPIIVKDRSCKQPLWLFGLPYLDPDTWRYRLAAPWDASSQAPLVTIDLASPDLTTSTVNSSRLSSKVEDQVSILPSSQTEEPHELDTTADDLLPSLPRNPQGVMSGALKRIRNWIQANYQTAAKPTVIVMAHAFVTGGEVSDSERDITVGGVATIPSQLFLDYGFTPEAAADFHRQCDHEAYFALGHLHRPQTVAGKDNLKYSGSPLPFSFSEAGYEKTITVVELDAGQIKTKDLVVPPWRRLVRLKGSIDEVIAQAQDPQIAQSFAEITITDNARPEALYARLRAAFPYLLVYVHQPTNPVSLPGPEKISLKEADIAQVIADFLEQVGGDKPSEQELQVVNEIVEEVRLNRESA
ncbi:hypothetical protein BK816_03520 [Boudabousia tangfeifanii]|uniref:Nuclease SbcCD subunit D n=1 Tax=Boudabousia tangfeifanii TaxID=1912795 RepID=A0A1D9MJT8_9ACTO|nr:exonuclease SbcCD subunit D [Boudabousia tangfeifanii]AOZ72478.1 hypothetical protein BK816_03520 [Boudabousia tangfeifanii]